MKPPIRSLLAACLVTLGVTSHWAQSDDAPPARTRKETVAKEADGNLVVNGSFERRNEGQPNSHIESLARGTKALVGWEVIESERPPVEGGGDEGPGISNVDWLGPERWTASHGKHCLDLDGGIRQAVPTKAGQRYVLRFDLAGNPEAEPMVQHLRVIVGEKAHEFDFDSRGKTKRSLGWATKRVSFTAEGERTTLTFVNAKPNAQSAGVALDNVVLREEPDRS
jgi:choice-of-anchor C domain-containing protein